MVITQFTLMNVYTEDIKEGYNEVNLKISLFGTSDGAKNPDVFREVQHGL